MNYTARIREEREIEYELGVQNMGDLLYEAQVNSRTDKDNGWWAGILIEDVKKEENN